MKIHRIIYLIVMLAGGAIPSLFGACVPEAATVGETIWHIADRIVSVIAGPNNFNVIRQADIPFTIGSRGYYVFAEDITSDVPAAITIASGVQGVWIDMHGHTLIVQNTNASGVGVLSLGGQFVLRNGRIMLQNVNNANANNGQVCISYQTGGSTNSGDPHVENMQLIGDVNSVTGIPFGVGIALGTTQAGTFKRIQARTFSVGIFATDVTIAQDTLFYECFVENASSECFRISSTAGNLVQIATLIKCTAIPLVSGTGYGFSILNTTTLADQARPTAELIDCFTTHGVVGYNIQASDTVLRNCTAYNCTSIGFDLLQGTGTIFGGSGQSLIKCVAQNCPVGINIGVSVVNSLVYKCVVEGSSDFGIFVDPGASNSVLFGNQVLSRVNPATSTGIFVGTTVGPQILGNYVKDDIATNFAGPGVPILVSTTDADLTANNYWYNVSRN